MKKIRQILFKLELEGNGIVNNDSIEQKWVFNNEDSPKTNHLKTPHKNVSYAKKDFYYDEDNNLWYEIKISSDALRNNIFRHDLVAQTSSIQHHPSLLYSYIASPLGMIRGYMFASNKETIKRGSPLTITGAMQTTKNKSYLETHSKSGEKDTHDGKESADTTFFKKESVGNIEYFAKGSINLNDLEFIPCDSIFDRFNFNPDNYESLYKKFAEINIPNFSGELGYHTLSNSCIDMGEYGLKISSDNVKFLVKETLKKLLGINFQKASSYATIKSLNIKLVENVLVDTHSNENGWIKISSIDDIEMLDFEVESAYVLQDESKAKEIRGVVEEAYKAEQAKKKAKKTPKKNKSNEENN